MTDPVKENDKYFVLIRKNSLSSTLTRKLTNIEKSNEIVSIKILMPDKTLLTISTNDNTAGEFLVKICTKRGLNPDKHHFENEKEETIIDSFPLAKLAGVLLRLSENKEILGLEYLSDEKVMAFESFNVVKLRKGKKPISLSIIFKVKRKLKKKIGDTKR